MDRELLWALVVIVPLLVIEALAIFHLIAHRPDLGVTSKAGWGAAVVLLPYMGVLTYALMRPPAVASGKAAEDEATGSTMRQLRKVMAAHDSGQIDDEQYAAAKAELFGVSGAVPERPGS